MVDLKVFLNDVNDLKDTNHFFLRCLNFSTLRTTLLDELNTIEPNLVFLNENDFIETLLFGNSNFSCEINYRILMCTISYVKNTTRFDGELF